MQLFVPGRICLFGEHSDWAGGYRRFNAELEKGYTLITGTNQGIFAEVRPHPTRFVLRSAATRDNCQQVLDVPMDKDTLLKIAQEGGFFSYAAGVAYQVMVHYRVRGLEIDNYQMDLPVKKGLSSSAAICVLVARAFNRVYDLKMTVRGEMELAYLGEITTPSRCGRMDQACAYGSRPLLMIFDGEQIEIQELTVPRDLYFVVVDLKACKDTREILNKLHHCYPFAENEIQKNVQSYLGPINKKITLQAVEAIQKGDAALIGSLMLEAQKQFDTLVQPACPSQLTAPVLHRVLSYPALQPYIWGGKGVGSQGDGSAQFIVRDQNCQGKVISLVEQELGMEGLALTIRSGTRVRKAIIPAAGFGPHLFPATKAIKKEVFPVVDSYGRAKPVILFIVEEALATGIEEVCLIVQKNDRDIFEEFFGTPPSIENLNKLSEESKQYLQYLMEVGRRVTIISQDVQEGFGHAVYCSRSWINQEPFLLLLGDHLYVSSTDLPCASQLLKVYERFGCNVVGLKITPEKEVHQFGCVTGTWRHPGSILDITSFYEKPGVEYARKHLRVEGIPENSYLTIFGLYILKPKIFDFLEEHIRLNIREHGEFQLTSCLDRLRQEDEFIGYLVQGQRFDIGTPEAFRQTIIDFPLMERKEKQ